MSDNNTKTYHWDSGKGSRPRSYSVSQEEFGKNWDAIFGKKEMTLGDGNNIHPMTQDEIDELTAVLDELEDTGCSTTVEVEKAAEG